MKLVMIVMVVVLVFVAMAAIAGTPTASDPTYVREWTKADYVKWGCEQYMMKEETREMIPYKSPVRFRKSDDRPLRMEHCKNPLWFPPQKSTVVVKWKKSPPVIKWKTKTETEYKESPPVVLKSEAQPMVAIVGPSQVNAISCYSPQPVWMSYSKTGGAKLTANGYGAAAAAAAAVEGSTAVTPTSGAAQHEGATGASGAGP